MGLLRTSVGIALMVAPGAPMRLAGTESPTGAALLLMRTIGIRDLVLGLGTVSAARSNDQCDARSWLTATLASDALDTAIETASDKFPKAQANALVFDCRLKQATTLAGLALRSCHNWEPWRPN